MTNMPPTKPPIALSVINFFKKPIVATTVLAGLLVLEIALTRFVYGPEGIDSLYQASHLPPAGSIQELSSTAPKSSETAPDTRPAPENDQSASQAPAQTNFLPPMPDYKQRLTKKPFGLYVSPQNSPVAPERFQGFHAAIDLETYEHEQGQPVEFSAVCSGKLALKRTAQGYGGVVAQYCTYHDQQVLVIYGHVDLSSIPYSVGDEIKPGARIGILGEPGDKTDFERKHLHLGIRKGHSLVIAGYVRSEEALKAYLDPLSTF